MLFELLCYESLLSRNDVGESNNSGQVGKIGAVQGRLLENVTGKYEPGIFWGWTCLHTEWLLMNVNDITETALLCSLNGKHWKAQQNWNETKTVPGTILLTNRVAQRRYECTSPSSLSLVKRYLY